MPNLIMNLEDLEKKLNTTFSDKDLLIRALTHRSYLNESKLKETLSNERLEFLGDAVLQCLSSDFLFSNYPDKKEGDLTAIRAAIVNTHSLAAESKKLGYGAYLRLSKGEEDSGGRDKEYILANTFESVLGAIYIDKGFEQCRMFLQTSLFYKVKDIVQNEDYRDKKSVFQETAQEKYLTTPNYEILKESATTETIRFW